MSAYEVTGPLALVTDNEGKVRYYYQGAMLPDDIDPEQRDRLVQRGLVSEQAGSGDVPAATAGRPPLVATKAQWVDYAVSQGMDPAEAEGLTKQELIDRFG